MLLTIVILFLIKMGVYILKGVYILNCKVFIINLDMMYVYAQLLSCVQLFVTP